MEKEPKTLINALKTLLKTLPCALWSHDQNKDKLCMFGGADFHIIMQTRGGEIDYQTMSQIPAYQRLKSLENKIAGLYVRNQPVRKLSSLVKHLMIPPRLYMGSSCCDIGAMIEYETYADACRLEDEHFGPCIDTATLTTRGMRTMLCRRAIEKRAKRKSRRRRWKEERTNEIVSRACKNQALK